MPCGKAKISRSNVLPELGEEPVTETSFEEIAAELLGNSLNFERLSEQIETILEESDQRLAERIGYKSSFEFLSLLDEYLEYTEHNNFCPCDYCFDKIIIPKDFIQTRYIQSVVQFVSPIAAGAIMSVGPIYNIMFIDVATAVIGISILALIKIPNYQSVEKTKNSSVFTEMKEGFNCCSCDFRFPLIA